MEPSSKVERVASVGKHWLAVPADMFPYGDWRFAMCNCGSTLQLWLGLRNASKYNRPKVISRNRCFCRIGKSTFQFFHLAVLGSLCTFYLDSRKSRAFSLNKNPRGKLTANLLRCNVMKIHLSAFGARFHFAALSWVSKWVPLLQACSNDGTFANKLSYLMCTLLSTTSQC